MNAHRCNRSHAFTLLEVMIAIALLAMIVTAIYSSWNAILKGSRVALDASASSQRERITMRTLQDSLLCACMFNSNPSNYVFEAESDGDFSTLSFVARLPRAFPRNDIWNVEVRRLSFKVESGENSKSQLVLRQRPIVSEFGKTETSFPLVLARDVTKFLVEFVDPQTGEWVSEWTYTNQLPKEARITLGMGHLDQFSSQAQEAVVAVVALPAHPIRVEWQMPNGGGLNNTQQNGVNNGKNPNPNNNPNNNGTPQPNNSGSPNNNFNSGGFKTLPQ